MLSRWRVLGAAVVAAALVSTASVPAPAASWLEKLTGLGFLGYEGQVPPCDDAYALWRIQSRFAAKESQFWASPLEIVRFENVRQTAFRPWARDTIPRRFCSARVLISDGRWRPVYYSIIEDGGMIGAVSGVEWCVVGLDRNWAYNPRCRMARP